MVSLFARAQTDIYVIFEFSARCTNSCQSKFQVIAIWTSIFSFAPLYDTGNMKLMTTACSNVGFRSQTDCADISTAIQIFIIWTQVAWNLCLNWLWELKFSILAIRNVWLPLTSVLNWDRSWQWSES